MVSQISVEQANYILNIGLHVFILFTFLTIFFFAYVSKLASETIRNALDNIIGQEVGKLLTKLDKLNNKLENRLELNWSAINDLAKKVEQRAAGELPEIVENNKNLKRNGMIAIIGMGVLLVGLFIYFTFVMKYDIHIGQIIAENVAIFVFIGAIEYFFFTKIASKYIPVTPDFVAVSILERVKQRVTQNLAKNQNEGMSI